MSHDGVISVLFERITVLNKSVGLYHAKLKQISTIGSKARTVDNHLAKCESREGAVVDISTKDTFSNSIIFLSHSQNGQKAI